ncbi:MAG: pyridoxal-phosphate dependent enzyme [Acidimicrobiales bacterium]
MGDPSGFSLDDIRWAAERLDGIAHRTPVHSSRTLDRLAGGRVRLKCENFQRGGAFKFRGAYNAMSALPERERRRGVCAVSSGNHAQAVAIAAQVLGVPVVICMPEDAPSAKLEATAGYGAQVVLYDRYSMPQWEAGQRLQAERGLTFISSHDDPMIAAGAGTAALELIEDTGPLDVLLAPVGGGGGMAGHATVVDALCPTATVIAVEPAASRLLSRSIAAHQRVTVEVPHTIADGQQLTQLGAWTFDVLEQRVHQVVAVDDGAIVDAMRFVFDHLKLVTEPSGVIAVAALLSGQVPLEGRSAGVIVTGGNVGVQRFAELVSRDVPATRAARRLGW